MWDLSSLTRDQTSVPCIVRWILYYWTTRKVPNFNNRSFITSQFWTEKLMAPHSSTLSWKIPWTEEPGRLQSMGLRRVGHDWANSLSLSCIGERNGNPLQCSCLENPRDRGAWWASIYGIAQSQTRLKQLSSIEYINWISNIELTLYSWHKSHLIMVYNLFYMLLDSVC